MSEAQDFIRSARKIGCSPVVDGSWIKWEPPLPIEMIMNAVRLADEIAKEITAGTGPHNDEEQANRSPAINGDEI